MAKPLALLHVTDVADDRLEVEVCLYCATVQTVKMSPDVSEYSILTDSVPHKGIPVVHSGVKDMKVLKTTQSGFEGFLRDRFTTLQEAKDRCFCTSIYARWRYTKIQDVDFDAMW